jgi:hypothetical protein
VELGAVGTLSLLNNSTINVNGEFTVSGGGAGAGGGIILNARTLDLTSGFLTGTSGGGGSAGGGRVLLVSSSLDVSSDFQISTGVLTTMNVAVPEPSSILLLALGLPALFYARRHGRNVE